MRHIRLLSLALCAVVLGAVPGADMARADEFDSGLRAELRPGWRLADGSHMAALHLTLAPGWKTYWRAPGDAGIPPLFNWSGSQNAASVGVVWPTPKVFHQAGMRSVGYADEVVLPLRIAARQGGDIRLRGEMQLGVCKDICLPETLRFDAVLPAGTTRPDPVIAAAMAEVPFSESEARVGTVRCSIGAGGEGLTLRAEIDMPTTGGAEETVVETANPLLWVAEPKTRREGGKLVTETRMEHVEGRAFALDRSAVRITVLGGKHAVDIQGCDG
ncbi:protein-disulfide reductase DsbD domain-containing protein [Puniceibacterium sp. IMCC21224]|uniref:protein-disulfide reductase DsbD domain-containing protein n=1 Tax=Puniceibacterium sp. IMCC21224 TaxID=1618204 RepID=UPI00064DCC52|nr:protein-disulfide reductase DsbD domain-containing protein [Puniceibacterium sp. IMCC21224]KMK66591.1 protein involved in C-type cytochrome biogenesis [Puniceibacterium sp. IMCC21224]